MASDVQPNSPSASLVSEIDSTLSRLSSHRNVRGVMVLARPESPSSSRGGIIQSQGAVFEGDSGHKYALAIEDVVEKTSSALETCEPDDEVRFMRIRTRKHELIITPGDKYLLVVLQDPGS